jgi:hypothetical protein
MACRGIKTYFFRSKPYKVFQSLFCWILFSDKYCSNCTQCSLFHFVFRDFFQVFLLSFNVHFLMFISSLLLVFPFWYNHCRKNLQARDCCSICEIVVCCVVVWYGGVVLQNDIRGKFVFVMTG